MISATRRTRAPDSGRLLTIADLAALPEELPSGTVRYELDDGKLIIMPPPGNLHGAVESNLVTALKIQGEKRGLGKARSGDVGIVLRRNPDRVVGADAAFIAKRSLPIRESPEGYLETIPELVVEVRSKNETLASLRRKAHRYLDAGAVLVWVVDPQRRVVTAYRRGRRAQIYREDDVLTADDIIPGFELGVREALEE